MPIYYDYHVSSFLSTQNQKQICADFQQTSTRIIATMQEIQEEKNPNPKMQSQYDEEEDELDERRLYRGSGDRSTTVAMQRPPPEPPDLYSFEVGDGAPPDLNSIAVGECEPESVVVMAKAGLCRTEDLSDAVTEIHSGAEVGAVAKGNVDDDDAAMNDRAATEEDRTRHGGSMEDTQRSMAILVTTTVILAEVDSTRSLGDGGEQETTSSAEDGAIVETWWRTSTAVEDGEAIEKKNGAATMTGGSPRARLLRRFVLLTPPPLLAAVFPWDHDGGVKKQEVVVLQMRV
ncbi:hypothetical protein PIB30_050646 [Stylosanthes scabra]|uniref:Uncharacterized protein n=1 Tax=Stylosanthes scabra TaxID=79078 RepID=A0ABU6VFR4_9FABA|nr:hypothetical protein [Stylosanthes scabra]